MNYEQKTPLLKNPLVGQLARYVLIGIMNTGIDFAILFVLISITDITQGLALFGLNIASFTIATINSYVFNKYWTFKDKNNKQAAQFSQFLAISIVGALINSGLVALIATNVDPLFGLSDKWWTIAAKVIATGASLIWNFLGYKLIVFKEKKPSKEKDTEK